MVASRFDSMSDFYQNRFKDIVQIMSDAAQQVYNDFQSVVQMIQSNNNDNNLIDQFVVKFSHFLLFASNTLNLSMSGKGYYYYSCPDQQDAQNFLTQTQAQIWA